MTNFGAGGHVKKQKKGHVKKDNPYWRTGPLKQASKPAIVLLMLGTNDAKFGNWKGANIAQFPIDYKSMIDEFVQLPSKPMVLLMVPPPLYQDDRYGMNQTVINTLFPGDGSHWRDCHSAAPPSPLSRKFNSDREGMSVK